MAKVVNLYKEPYDVYIGRSKWGEPRNKWCNPFRSEKGEPPFRVINMYKKHLWSQIKKGEITIEDLISLDGKSLGCFCKPKPCHGDVVLKAIEWAKTQKGSTDGEKAEKETPKDSDTLGNGL
ncbi:hypothetical protein LAh9_130 [Aeromonas phage LAh_9]|uniref:DUF4326 domain-containing protein n=1 Tax=Aeromonas phage LAh_9 TaxID=2591033 RepID=A0A514A0Z2_9CAUD|nr:hypothetical protein HWC32_gp131 [Aeromonas phage LAh_9]QDH46940.1 hypothetical protein LAh9_130 [Aeromonas phage LAh_9]